MADGSRRFRKYQERWFTDVLAKRQLSRVEAMALRVLAERIEHGEMSPVIEKVFPVSSRISEIQNTMRSREPIIGLALLQHLYQPPTCSFSAGAV
jgi:hypothetical protein